MTARGDHNYPLRGSLTQPRFDRFLANKVLHLLGLFFINSSKKLIFGVREEKYNCDNNFNKGNYSNRNDRNGPYDICRSMRQSGEYILQRKDEESP